MLRASAAQDIVIKLVIRNASMRGSEAHPEMISRDRAVVILLGDLVQHLHQRPGGVHRKSVAGKEQDGQYFT